MYCTLRRRGAAASVVASLLSLSLGCASSTTATRLREVGSLPADIAVLPMSRSELRPELADLLRERIGGAFVERGHRRYDAAWIDQRLTRAGMQPWLAEWIDSDMRAVAWARSLGIPALVVLEDFSSEALTTGVFNQRSLSGRVRVVDVAKGETTWSYWIDSTALGGAILQSGQIFDAIGDTFGGSERADLVRFANLLSLSVADALPESRTELSPAGRPAVVAVGALPATDTTIEVVVTGTPECRAFASLPGCLGRYPLSEEASGRYVGTLPVPKPATHVIALLRDRFGRTSRSHTIPVGNGESAVEASR